MKSLRSLKDLKYGKLNKEDTVFLMNHNENLKNVIEDFKNVPYPDVKKTQEEIDTIIDIQKKAMSSPNWATMMNFCKNADEDLADTLSFSLSKIGIEIDSELLETLTDEIGNIIVSLKKHYNRPRPYQVAYYSEQDLNPFETVTGNSPAYPSGHSCQAWFICLALSKKHPDKKDKLEKIAKTIENSRIILGVHYPSDNLFGKQIAEILTNNEEFNSIL